jgi:3-methyladenine DNA glycosylase/8-oxoguanine DNA glycosylase
VRTRQASPQLTRTVTVRASRSSHSHTSRARRVTSDDMRRDRTYHARTCGTKRLLRTEHGRTHSRAPATADPYAREFLRHADPILRLVIDAQPNFRPRVWLGELPLRDAFAALILQVCERRLSVDSTRGVVTGLKRRFGGHLPSPQELIATDLHDLRSTGLSTREAKTLRVLAEGFLDGLEYPEMLLSGDLELRRIVARLYELDHQPTRHEIVQLAESWRPYRTLAVSYLFASKFGRCIER